MKENSHSLSSCSTTPFRFFVNTGQQKVTPWSKFVLCILAIFSFTIISYQAKAQLVNNWGYNSPLAPNGSLCNPPGFTWWLGYTGLRTQIPAVPLHVYTGGCLEDGIFTYDPAVERLQTATANYGFGQSSLQFWSGLQGNWDWHVGSIKSITNSTWGAYNATAPSNWKGGLSFNCSGAGNRPQVANEIEVMRLYDQRVAVNSETAKGRFDIRVGWGNYNPRFSFGSTNIGENQPALKMYVQETSGLTEFGNSYPAWLQLEAYGPTGLGTSQFSIMTCPATYPVGNENFAMLPRLTVTGSGNVGINQIEPDAKFQVTNGSVMFDGATGATPQKWIWSGSTWSTAEIGAGTRLMWIPEKAAFRAGRLGTTSGYSIDGSTWWNSANIGEASIAMGENVQSQAPWSTTIGRDCIVEPNAINSMAMGQECRVFHSAPTNDGHSSIALGHHSEITSSYDCLAMGYYVRIKNQSIRSVAMGRNVTIDEAPDSFVFGSGQTEIDEAYSLLNNKPRSFMVGFNTRKPALFVAGGEEEAISEDIGNIQQTSRVGIGLSTPVNTLDVRGKVVIGSGLTYAGAASAPANGLIVEGQTVIGGTTAVSGSALTVSGDGFFVGGSNWTTSDRNLKKDIISFKDGLTALKKINPVRFHYNGKLGIDSAKEHIGVIAQDIVNVAPYAVREETLITNKVTSEQKYVETDEIDSTHGEHKKKLRYVPANIVEEKNVFLAYNPSTLQYLAINAIKELDSNISKLETRLQTIETKDNTTQVNNTASGNDQYVVLEQRVKALEEKIQQIQTTCCKNAELYDDVLLEQNVPNPFAKQTIITYFVPSRLSGRIELVIADASGNTILQSVPAQLNIPAQYTYAPTNLQTGVYVYGISVNGQIVKSKKMMIIK